MLILAAVTMRSLTRKGFLIVPYQTETGCEVFSRNSQVKLNVVSNSWHGVFLWSCHVCHLLFVSVDDLEALIFGNDPSRDQ